MDYVKRLRKVGGLGRDKFGERYPAVDIVGVEFFLRQGLHLHAAQAQNDVTALCHDLETKGRFDIVICDSVLNSVDSVQAEADVLTCLAAFAKPGGLVIFSGRSRDSVEQKEAQATTNTDPDTRYVHFLDENGLTAMYSNGVWRYQKFHRLPEIETLTRRHFGDRFRVVDSDDRPAKSPLRASGWGVVAVNDKRGPASEFLPSLRREFDLPLPHGKTFGALGRHRAGVAGVSEAKVKRNKRRVNIQVHVKIEVKTDDFRFLWLKRVQGFNPSVHCAKCLVGSYVKGLPFRGTKTGFTLDTDVDMDGMPYLYLCGVAGRYADNLHLAMEPAAGEEVCYEDARIRVHVQGAKLLPIDPLPEAVASLLPAAFHKCRNFRFGWQYFPQDHFGWKSPLMPTHASPQS